MEDLGPDFTPEISDNQQVGDTGESSKKKTPRKEVNFSEKKILTPSASKQPTGNTVTTSSAPSNVTDTDFNYVNSEVFNILINCLYFVIHNHE